LRQGELLLDLVDQPGWQEVLKPFLEQAIRHKWLDPREVKDKEEFFYRYAAGWGLAQAAQEILNFIEDKKSEVRLLREKKEGKIPDFKIGR